MAGVIVVILVASIPIGYHEGVQRSNGYFAVESVTYLSYNASGYVDGMNVEIVYHGSLSNLTNVYFRIFPNQALINGNMYLWLTSGNVYLKPGVVRNITISPQYPGYSINPAVASVLVAYYGNIQGSHYLPLEMLQ